MSTIFYATLTSRSREGEDLSASSTLVRTLCALAAIVPIEALLINDILMLGVSGRTGGAVKIENTATLEAGFYALCLLTYVLSVALMLKAAPHKKTDSFLRSLIPPLALVGWLMLDRISSFDAAYGGLRDACRYMVAGLTLVVLLIVALAASLPSRS